MHYLGSQLVSAHTRLNTLTTQMSNETRTRNELLGSMTYLEGRLTAEATARCTFQQQVQRHVHEQFAAMQNTIMDETRRLYAAANIVLNAGPPQHPPPAAPAPQFDAAAVATPAAAAATTAPAPQFDAAAVATPAAAAATTAAPMPQQEEDSNEKTKTGRLLSCRASTGHLGISALQRRACLRPYL